MKYVLDSSAWIEYFEGSNIGEKVNKIIESDNEIYVLAVNIGEIISMLKRNSKDFKTAYESIVKRAKIVDITPRIAKDSGILHAEKRMKNSSFSLADSFIINAAKAIKAKVVTKDLQFKEFEESIII